MNDKYINVEGIILSNESLSNFQRIDAANKLSLNTLKKCLLRDELCKKPKSHQCGYYTQVIHQQVAIIRYVGSGMKKQN